MRNVNYNTETVLNSMLAVAIGDYAEACKKKDDKKKSEIRDDLDHGILADYIELRGLNTYELLKKTERYAGR